MNVGRLVGQNISRLRRERGLTQEQLAELSGISQQYLSGLERGHRNPSVAMVFSIAAALNVEPAALIKIESDAAI